MHSSCLTRLGACFLLAGAAFANDEKILGKDDLEFVRALSKNGYNDLAEELRAAIERSGKTKPEDQLRAKMVRLDLDEIDARREGDAVQRAARLTELLHAKQEFAKLQSGTPAADEVANSLPDLYQAIGEAITTALQSDPPPPNAEELRKQGSELYVTAVDVIKSRIDALNEKHNQLQEQFADLLNEVDFDPDTQTPPEIIDNDGQRMLALFNLARTYYFHALVLEDGFLRTSRLEAALETLANYQFDFPRSLLLYHGFIYEGLVHKKLGKPEQALESFESAIHISDNFERDNTGLFDVPPEVADVISSAVQQKMILLSENGKHAEAAEAAREFFSSIKGAYDSEKGRAVLVAQAEAYQQLGDSKSLEAAARKLIEIDPRGPGGQKGRELLGGGASGGGLGAIDTMRMAENFAGRADYDNAVRSCQRVLDMIRGTSDEQNLGAQAGLLLGAVYSIRQQYHEAVVAWDGAADRYKDGKDAPECLSRAISGYNKLLSLEQRPYYKQRARSRMTDLRNRYPQSSFTANSALSEGQQIEAEGDYVKAAEVYLNVPADSPVHDEGIYRAGMAWSREAAKRLQKKASDAKAAITKAEELLKQAATALEVAAGKTLDVTQQDKLRGTAYDSKVGLARLYLLEGVGRAGEVPPLLEAAEKGAKLDPKRVGEARNLRVKALIQTGKTDDAIKLLDQQMQLDETGETVASAAGQIAGILDQRGTELRKAKPDSAEANELWRKAAKYYFIAVRPQLTGADSVEPKTLEPVSTRLLVFALHFNGIPADKELFVEKMEPRPQPDYFDKAEACFRLLLQNNPAAYRTRILLARTLGYLGRWEECASAYAELFDQERFVDPVAQTINLDSVRAKPELMGAYLEWGVAEREAGVAEGDKQRLSHASQIFETLVLGNQQNTGKYWWLSKYYQLITLMDRGDYPTADLALRSLERGSPDFDEGKYELKDKFARLRSELSTKVFRNEPPPPPRRDEKSPDKR